MQKPALSKKTSTLEGRLEQELKSLVSKDRLRSLSPPRGLDFSSNDYLSLNESGILKKILLESLAELSQMGSTGSRLVSGEHPAFASAERAFAEFVNSEAALLFHSGYAANTGAIPALIGRRDLLFCDRLSHASLLDGIRLSGARRYYFRHNDLEDLGRLLKKHPPAKGGLRWIITETLFSMDGDLPNLVRLVELARRESCELYLDEAHALGLFGPRGGGRVLAEGLEREVAVRVFPCGKAPGLMGAFVAGSQKLKDFLINKSRSFVYSTAQPPFLARSLEKTFAMISGPDFDSHRTELQKKADFLRSRLASLGYDTLQSASQIVPVLLGSEASALAFVEKAQKAGFFLKAIRPPTVPEGQSRVRLCLHSSHSQEDMEALLALFARWTAEQSCKERPYRR